MELRWTSQELYELISYRLALSKAHDNVVWKILQNYENKQFLSGFFFPLNVLDRIIWFLLFKKEFK